MSGDAALTGNGDGAHRRVFDRVWQQYTAAPTEREAVYVLWQAMLGTIGWHVRLAMVWAASSLLLFALILFTLLVWPTLHGYQVQAGYDVIVHYNRITGAVEVIPLMPSPRR